MNLRILSALLFMAIALPQAAGAVDIFNKRPAQEKPADNAQPPAPDLPELKQEAPAPAPPKNINEAANRYYGHCMSQSNAMLDAENQEMLCRCTAANIPKTMTMEQMAQMELPTTEGQFQRNRMLMFVYTPCIEYPTRALVSYNCMSNQDLKRVMRSPAQICGCLADGMAKFMREKAPEAVEMALRRNMKDLDPLRMMMESPGYEASERQIMQNCIAEHAR